MTAWPKKLLNDPRLPEVERACTADMRPLWEGGTFPVARVATTEGIVAVLKAARRDRHLAQGLEQAARLLDNEQRGLEVTRAKMGNEAPPPRLSRLLLLGAGGSERFYRDAEAVLRRHEGRLMGLRFDETFEPSMRAVYGDNALVRALLVGDKEPVADLLLAVLV
ncbi:MAG: hypothetical protein RL199_1350 [Pseudomonadota bacterium]|jgi:hypothetical protein